MPKIFYVGIIIFIISFIYFITIYDHHELQVAQEKAQNVSQDEILKEEINKPQEEILKIEEKKFTNKIIFYSLIGILVFIVIIGAAIFLLPKCIEDEDEEEEDPKEIILSAEQAVENFIKIKRAILKKNVSSNFDFIDNNNFKCCFFAHYYRKYFYYFFRK